MRNTGSGLIAVIAGKSSSIRGKDGAVCPINLRAEELSKGSRAIPRFMEDCKSRGLFVCLIKSQLAPQKSLLHDVIIYRHSSFSACIGAADR
jgi:hypothetical protein